MYVKKEHKHSSQDLYNKEEKENQQVENPEFKSVQASTYITYFANQIC